MSVSLQKTPRTVTAVNPLGTRTTTSVIKVGTLDATGPVFAVEGGLHNGAYVTLRNGSGETVSVHLSDLVLDDLVDALRSRCARQF
jgi:hypothetical protein